MITAPLPAGWSWRPLGDCGVWLSGGTPRKSAPEFWGGNIPWISAKSLHSFFLSDSEDRLTELGAKQGSRIAPKNAILFIVRGMSLKSEFRMGIATRPVAFNQDLKALVAAEQIDSRFLAYAIKAKTPEILSIVDEAGHGTGRLAMELLQALQIPIPPQEEQRRIAAIVGALDDKIELNRRMNRTLEKMAQTLFKSWFIDFDGHTDFVDSELGPIPHGWTVQPLGSLIGLAYGKSLPAKKRAQGRIPVYGSGGVSGTHNEALVSGPGVIVGRKGSIGTLYWEDRDFFPIDTTFYVETGSRAWLAWAYHTLKTIDMAHLGSDSAVPGVNRHAVLGQTCAIPPTALVEKFWNTIASRIRKRMSLISAENDMLADLRDALLPKLISGELIASDAKRIVEAAS